jgi:hypothetical protein
MRDPQLSEYLVYPIPRIPRNPCLPGYHYPEMVIRMKIAACGFWLYLSHRSNPFFS